MGIKYYKLIASPESNVIAQMSVLARHSLKCICTEYITYSYFPMPLLLLVLISILIF